MCEAGGTDAVQNGKDCGVSDAFVSLDVDAARASRPEVCLQFVRELLRRSFLAIKKEPTIAKDKNQQGVQSLGFSKRYGITNFGQLHRYSIMERESHGLEKQQTRGEHRKHCR